MIQIREPRYRDRKVLIARYRIPCGQGVDIEILKGAYKGRYHISNDAISKSAIETMKTKSGFNLPMRAVAIDYLERID